MMSLESFTEPPKISSLARVLLAWKVLLIGFFVGGLLGAVVYRILPPLYRVTAVVVINQNLERVFPDSTDREIFYFLERETNRLEELAFSDRVVEKVASQISGVTVAELRTSSLVLAQPSDGGWQMIGQASDPVLAKSLAVTWAKVFTEEVQRGVDTAVRIEAVEDQLDQGNLSEDQMDRLTEELSDLQRESLGIHPEAQVYLSQQKDLKPEPVRSIALFILAGAMSALGLAIVLGALFLREKE